MQTVSVNAGIPAKVAAEVEAIDPIHRVEVPVALETRPRAKARARASNPAQSTAVEEAAAEAEMIVAEKTPIRVPRQRRTSRNKRSWFTAKSSKMRKSSKTEEKFKCICQRRTRNNLKVFRK